MLNITNDSPQTAASILARSFRPPFYPLVVDRADGTRLWDIDGREYLDCQGMAGSVLTGYGHERVRDAVVDAVAGDYQLLTSLVPGAAAISLAGRLIDLVPARGSKRVWYGSSGAGAIDMLVKVAPIVSGRARLVSYEGGHHGMTIGSGRVSADSTQRQSGEATNVVKAPFPDPYRCAWGPCDPQECSLRCLRFLDEHILEITSPREQTAAILIEAIQSSSGEIVPPDNYLPALRELCDRHGIWLIVDEVKTGLGRTGRMFAFEHSDIEPDAVVIGKGLGGGLPLSAVVGRAELLDHDVLTVQTLGGSVASCYAALATLDVIEDENLTGNAAERGKALLEGIAELTRDHPLVGHVRGKGLLVGIEFVTDRSSRAPNPLDAKRLAYLCFENGLLVKFGGVHGNVVGLTPPLTFSPADVELALAILAHAFASLDAGRFDDERVHALWHPNETA